MVHEGPHHQHRVVGDDLLSEVPLEDHRKKLLEGVKDILVERSSNIWESCIGSL